MCRLRCWNLISASLFLYLVFYLNTKLPFIPYCLKAYLLKHVGYLTHGTSQSPGFAKCVQRFPLSPGVGTWGLKLELMCVWFLRQDSRGRCVLSWAGTWPLLLWCHCVIKLKQCCFYFTVSLLPLWKFDGLCVIVDCSWQNSAPWWL